VRKGYNLRRPPSAGHGESIRASGKMYGHFTEMCSGSEAGSYLRLIHSCITQIKAQVPSRTCNESKEEEEDLECDAQRVVNRPNQVQFKNSYFAEM